MLSSIELTNKIIDHLPAVEPARVLKRKDKHHLLIKVIDLMELMGASINIPNYSGFRL